jgi:N-acetylglucosaminyl-diphospho-decaprenol L-rhamnosyltransferase
MGQPLIGVAIVSYNTRDLLRGCLESLRGCRLPLRTVVVDHASPDGSAAMVASEFPGVELLARADNPGFAGGTNLALRRLGFCEEPAGGPRADLALLLNPDTIVHPGALEALAGFLEAHPRVGMAGPRLLNPDGTTQPAAFRFPTLSMTLLDLFPPGEALPGRLYGSWWHGRYPQDGGEAPFPIDHPLGACMLVRREALEQAGPMDEGYFMYSEEVEWCWRIRRAGWAIWQAPAARVTHVGGAATGQFRRPMQLALWRSRARFAAQMGPPWRPALHRAIVRAGMFRLTLLAWRDYASGRIERDELRARLLTYGEIGGL